MMDVRAGTWLELRAFDLEQKLFAATQQKFSFIPLNARATATQRSTVDYFSFFREWKRNFIIIATTHSELLLLADFFHSTHP